MRNCTRDEGGPFGFGNQVLISSHRKLLRSKAVVVSVAETPGRDSGRHGRERRAQANRCRSVEAAPGPKYKAALSAAYSAGLRVSEVVALKVSDIDSERLLLRIEQGKGRKDRFAMLSPKLLEL